MSGLLPSASDVHVDRPLTNISIAYMQDASNFVASSVFPRVPVGKQSDRYFTIERGDFNRDEAKKRAPGTESAGGGYRVDNTPTFYCDVTAFHKDIPAQIISNADEALDLENGAAEFVAHKMLIRREKDWATSYFTDSVWGTDIDGVASSPSGGQALHWNDDASTPVQDVRNAITTVQESTGFSPNTMTIGKRVFDKLEDHPDIVDRIKYSGMTGRDGNPARVNERTLAALWGLERVFVMSAIENTADEGQTSSHSFIGGKHALLSYSPRTPGRLTPSAGYTFTWTGYMGLGNEHGFATSRWWEQKIKSWRVEGEQAFDQKLIASDLGYFFNGIIA